MENKYAHSLTVGPLGKGFSLIPTLDILLELHVQVHKTFNPNKFATLSKT